MHVVRQNALQFHMYFAYSARGDAQFLIAAEAQ